MDYILNSWKSHVFFCALCTAHQFGANLVSRQCIWSELSTSFHRVFLSGHSRMSIPALGSGSRKQHGFNGTLLGAMTMALFVKIAGRKKGNLTSSYPPAWPHPILPPTFGECSLEGDMSTLSLRHPVGAGLGGGAMVTIFWSKMMASEGVPRGNGHIGKKSAGQNARRWMTNSCLWNIMTKTWVVHSAQSVP